MDYGLRLSDPALAPATLGNRVWLDTNADGHQDTNESGLAGVVVKLYDATGEFMALTVTDNNGNYAFTNLPPGAYFVEFIMPDGYAFSPLGLTIGSDNDSNADLITGRTPPITLTAGAQDLSWDAGFYQKPTDLEEGNEPNGPVRAVYLPLAARKGIKVMRSNGAYKLIFVPCQGERCLMP